MHTHTQNIDGDDNDHLIEMESHTHTLNWTRKYSDGGDRKRTHHESVDLYSLAAP